MKKLFTRAGVAAASLMLSVGAFAGTASTDATFKPFADMVLGWAKGPLGTGLAVTMMLMGAGMGVAKIGRAHV